MTAVVGRHRSILALDSLVQLDSAGIDLVDAVITCLDFLLVNPELPLLGRLIALLGSVPGDVLQNNQGNGGLLPEHVGAAHLPVPQRGDVGNIKPVGGLAALEWRVGPAKIDADVLAEEILAV